MKKAKLIPSILMLVLCVGVLAVGIYAATPANNNINGTIKVNAANSAIEVTGYIDGTEKYETTSTRTGITWELADEITFSVDGKNNAWNVDDVIINLHIKNKSSKELGVYFYDGEKEPITDQVTNSEDVLTYKEYTTGEDVVVKAYFCSYSHMMPYDDNAQTPTTTDEVDMKICLSLEKMLDEDESFTFDIDLMVEEYEAYEVTDVYDISGEIVRIPSHWDGYLIDDWSWTDEGYLTATGNVVVVPNCVTTSLGLNVLSSKFNIPMGMIDFVTNYDFDYECKSVFLPATISEWDSFEAGFDSYFIVDTNNTTYSSDSQGILYNKNKTEVIQANSNIKELLSTTTKLGRGCFKNLEIGMELVLPDGLVEIGGESFAGTTAVNLVIPTSVTTMADAFKQYMDDPTDDCKLTNVTFKGTMAQFQAISGSNVLIEAADVVCTDGTL